MITSKTTAQHTLLVSVLLLSQLIGLTPLPVLADASVRLAGKSVFSVPDQEGQSIQNNLDNALVATQNRNAAAVGVTYVNSMPVITLGGFQVATIDNNMAAAGTSAPVLANKWADALRGQLADQNAISTYVTQLTSGAAQAPPMAPPGAAPNYQGSVGYQNFQGGNASYAQPNQQPPSMYNGGLGGGSPYGQPGLRQGRVAMAPAGLNMPISLQTSISTQVAKTGDMIQAQLSQPIYLGDAVIPAGSVLEGTITSAESGRRLSRSGELTIKFNSLRTPDGIQTPISAHLVGGIGKYTGKGTDDQLRGEGMTAKLGQTAIRGGVGAGAGAALGTALGAIAGRSGTAVGRGAWGGAAIGGGVGMADMLIRKGRDVVIPSGTAMNIQLDAPTPIAGGGMGGMQGQIATPPGGYSQ